MFQGTELKSHFENSTTIRSKALVVAEWNMNLSDNILQLGNYRYRSQGNDIYKSVASNFQASSNPFTLGATDADVTVESGFAYDETTETDIPQLFTDKKKNVKLTYSLEDCIKPFRPRSGINKAAFFKGRYLSVGGSNIAQRPRYYVPSRNDYFKYWTSYRTEQNIEYGISKPSATNVYYIDDACPYVVYKNLVPANRIVVKMQTHSSDLNLGPYTYNNTTIQDPFYNNKKIPVRWRIEYLQANNVWTTAISFNESSTRKDGSAVIPTDGNVEVSYGLQVPEQYVNSFVMVAKVNSTVALPEKNVHGYAYLVVENPNSLGSLYIWNGATKEYDVKTPEYKWSVANNSIDDRTNFVTQLVEPEYYNSVSGQSYREFCYIKGIRVVVETMSQPNSTFDLIEMSPRLLVDMSSRTMSYNIKKSLGDVGNTSLPIGQLLASTGSIEIFDYDQSFNNGNPLTILKDYTRRNVKFSFYESIIDLNDNSYTIPIKTLYSEGFPQANRDAYSISIQLRDLFFLLESIKAPALLIPNCSLSYAVSVLLDSIGFSNYTFYRTSTETDLVIPFFYSNPDKSVADILNDLAVSAQCAMFFDEYNNFVVMNKNYLIPAQNERSVTFNLVGSDVYSEEDILKNKKDPNKILPNIISIASEDKKIFNDGKITYTNRYIQRAYSSIQQAYTIGNDKTWGYKPVELWEVSGTENTMTVNENPGNMSTFSLSAMPLNSDVTSNLPTVVNNVLINNTVDFGENIIFISRFQGYFFANGEIIKYDAVQYNVEGIGNVWISSNQEYQSYVSKLKFNGKIYPTGLIRIFATPYYETVNAASRMKNGPVFEHGRGQFGTTVTSHSAGLPISWGSATNLYGCNMQAQYLFNINQDTTLPAREQNLAAGIANDVAAKSFKSGIIKNFLGTNNKTETEIYNLKSTESGTIQSSAFIFQGPSFKTTEIPLNHISYAVSPDAAYRYNAYGTRMRIIGKIENSETKVQTPLGSTSYYQVPGAASPDQSINIAGGSGGIAIGLNKQTNAGYFYEIAALTETNLESYAQGNSGLNNIVFYKINKAQGSNAAIPVKLWGGLAKIIVDDGLFFGQQRVVGEQDTTVYDLGIEFQDISANLRRFFLYFNGKLIATVDDKDPLTKYNDVALFVRGSSKCMFEHIYAIGDNFAEGRVQNNSVFTSINESISSAFNKYAISGIISGNYLESISSESHPSYKIYFEEFGTTMRECAYFKIKYDKAYPALYSKLLPTFNKMKSYTVSGFLPNPYGAEFLIFNNTDTILSLDESSGNYLKINGVGFTQDTTQELTVDKYFNKVGNLSDPEVSLSGAIRSPIIENNKFNEIKLSRINYGRNEFTIDAPYIQSEDAAQGLMEWVVNKLMKPKKSIGVKIFPIPTLQLGDIVNIDYKTFENIDLVASTTDNFIIYNIEYSRSSGGPEMTLYLSEVG